MTTENRKGVSRRRFLQTSTLAVAGATVPFAHAGATSELPIKIGLIGCGGRGTGAVLDALGAATRVIYPAEGYHTEDVAERAWVGKKDIQVVALGTVDELRSMMHASSGESLEDIFLQLTGEDEEQAVARSLLEA